MKRIGAWTLGLSLTLVAFLGAPTLTGPAPAGAFVAHTDTLGAEAVDATVGQYCVRCHNDRRLRGNLSLEDFSAGSVQDHGERTERMIRKLRAGMMPPVGARRPTSDTLAALAASLEVRMDAAAARDPNPGARTFQRLTRAEYERAVHDLLGLQIDASAYLPGETVSAGFDNIADVQTLSPTLLDAYLTAASEISRLVMGDSNAAPAETTYEVSRYASQREHVEGAPIGTRGGISVVHTFPADGMYVFRMSFAHESTGNLFGQTAPWEEQLEISVNGERRALLPIDRWMHVSDPNGVNMETEPIFIPAGPQRVSAAFLKQAEGPLEDLTSPHDWSLADKKIGYSYGITSLPHLQDLSIGGPWETTGVSDTPLRRRVLSCTPQSESDAEPCARRILGGLAARAYRRPLEDADLDLLMDVYADAAAQDGFEVGVRTALQAILASPDFLFRFEEPADDVAVGESYRIAPMALASRLSFFLWATLPDEDLIEAARSGALLEPEGLAAQVDRMLADPRAETLGSRFAAQWLRLQDLEKVHPDALMFPDFDEQLSTALRDETVAFFNHLVSADRPLLEVLTADYTFLNERLARHYRIPDVTGPELRRVQYPGDERRGLLGHGSILTLTSHANRTSPVLRGKWVMEVFLGSPPPPPPPDVPELDATSASEDGKMLTVRERLEMHRESPACSSCHRMMDPIGLALENFDVTGRWRIRDSGIEVDATGELYDGTELTHVSDLRGALLRHPEALVRTFTENLMAYATGRRIEYYDMPTVRRIAREAAENDYRLSAFIQGVVASDAFRMARMEAVAEDLQESGR